MRARIVQAWEKLRASYWFIPSLMALAAAGLSEVAIRADGLLGFEWLREAGWLYTNEPEGARQVLSTVAGSMITVAGVTFSMTILAISHASGQIGPRLLTDFMRDRGNQVTLGTFIATFIYCLLVLRTVRGGSSSSSEDALDAFVPHVAVVVALVLALLSVGVLIYFIHHVPETISMSRLLERVGDTLMDRIHCLYPTEVGAAPAAADEDPPPDARPADFEEHTEPLLAVGTIGYLQYVDGEALMQSAHEHDLVVELARRPGEFVRDGSLLARVYPAGAMDDGARTSLLACFAYGPERTPRQDVLFPALEIVEVAVRALSPGVNDPLTAMRCIDRLEAALILLARRETPAPQRLDDQGRVRVLAPPVGFADFADAVLDGLRPYVRADPLCAVHLLRMIAAVAAAVPRGVGAACLARHMEALRAAAEDALAADERDLELVRAAARTFEPGSSRPRARSRA